MPDNNDRKFKVLGAGWLVLGALAFAVAAVAFLSVVLADDSESAAFKSGDMWWIVVLVSLVLAAVFSANGLAFLRRYPAARPLIIVSSLVLLPPSVVGLAAGGAGVLTLLVVLPSLWLTLSKRGKEAFADYMAYN